MPCHARPCQTIFRFRIVIFSGMQYTISNGVTAHAVQVRSRWDELRESGAPTPSRDSSETVTRCKRIARRHQRPNAHCHRAPFSDIATRMPRRCGVVGRDDHLLILLANASLIAVECSLLGLQEPRSGIQKGALACEAVFRRLQIAKALRHRVHSSLLRLS